MIEDRIRIGTSGYTYSWNKAKPNAFQWYINQGFNSVEINYSFYRFPPPASINLWRIKAPQDFTFSIKVHRSITHYNRLKQPRSSQLWDKFLKLFETLEHKVDFWLFQMPANFKFNAEKYNYRIKRRNIPKTPWDHDLVQLSLPRAKVKGDRISHHISSSKEKGNISQ